MLGDLEDIELGVEAEPCGRTRRSRRRLASSLKSVVLLARSCAAEQATAGHAPQGKGRACVGGQFWVTRRRSRFHFDSAKPLFNLPRLVLLGAIHACRRDVYSS